jgi:predicted GIY-YIG superfamily endonuclease
MAMNLKDAKLKSDSMTLKTHYVYIFQCEGNKRYCGMTGHVINRFVAHATKNGSRVTKAFPPINLLHLESVDSFLEAIRKEIKIKKMMRKKWDIKYSIVPEYQGIFQIIQEMLKQYSGPWVKRKLNAIERGGTDESGTE